MIAAIVSLAAIAISVFGACMLAWSLGSLLKIFVMGRRSK